MLGVFFPYDDVSLGVTRFRAGPLPARLPPADEVASLTDEWCDAALANLPMPTLVYENARPAAQFRVLARAARTLYAR